MLASTDSCRVDPVPAPIGYARRARHVGPLPSFITSIPAMTRCDVVKLTIPVRAEVHAEGLEPPTCSL